MDENEKVNGKLELGSGETDIELELTISDKVFSSEFGGFLPEQNFFIPQLD